MCRNPKNAELWLKSIRIEAEAGLEDIAKVNSFRILPFSHKCVERTEIMPAKYDLNTKF
jgi:hypothetical protein